MLFTPGIRKIYTPQKYYGDFDTLLQLAEAAGYSSVSHNGRIYILDNKKWVETPFDINDFIVDFSIQRMPKVRKLKTKAK